MGRSQPAQTVTIFPTAVLDVKVRLSEENWLALVGVPCVKSAQAIELNASIIYLQKLPALEM